MHTNIFAFRKLRANYRAGRWENPVHRTPALAAALALSLGTAAGTYADEITWTGCGITKKAFMAEIAAAYEAKTGDAVKLSGGGATKGIRSVAAGTSDVGGACRHRLTDADGIHTAESEANLVPVAWDALVVITHRDNVVDDISLDNLKKVFDGEITTWKDLGGPDNRIFLVTREGTSSGVGHMFRLMVFGKADYPFKARSLKVKSTGPLEKKVEKVPHSLGIDGISSAKKRNVKILSVDGMLPTKENIANGSYKLFRPLYIVTHKNPSEDAAKLTDFLLSPAGQEIISQQGTVNLAEGRELQPQWEQKMHRLGF